MRLKIAFIYMNDAPSVGRGAGYVAGAAVQAGHSVDFFDTPFAASIKNVSRHIIQGNYDIVMISSMTILFPEALKLIKSVKKQQNIPVLVGGVHPTIIGKQLLEQHEEIDYLCIGEGESMVVDFLNHFGGDSLYEVQNLTYRRKGVVYSNLLRPAEDLSRLLFFPWHFFQKQSIVQRSHGFLYVNATEGVLTTAPIVQTEFI